MTQTKKVVDDYYLHINDTPDADESSISKVDDKKRIKLKAKKATSEENVESAPIKVWKISKIEPVFSDEDINEVLVEAPKNGVSVKKKVIFQDIKKIERGSQVNGVKTESVELKKEEPREKMSFGARKKSEPVKLPVIPTWNIDEISKFSFSFGGWDIEKSTWVEKNKQVFKNPPLKSKGKKDFWKNSSDSDEGYKAGKKSKLTNYWDKKKNPLDLFDDGDGGFIRSTKIHKKKEEKNVEDIIQNLTSRLWETVTISEVLSLKELSEKMGVPLPKLIAEFMKNGMMVNINSKIDFDSASIIAEAFDIKLEKDNSSGISVKDLIDGNIQNLLKDDDMSKLTTRPPVVSIMGHVDHGKTSLLDYIRNAKVASWEAGWITQSIGAYQVVQKGKKITFLDTPGHEAFTIMRARWAKSTDIAILVVAADEWVKPQTIESINHAKEAGIPVIVAINKMDKEGANPDHVKSQLSENGLIPEDWGWDTPMIPVSAKTGFWIDELLEIIILIAEMKNFKANAGRAWIATVIESHLDNKLGPVATVLVNAWSLNLWDNIVCRATYWKIKILKDYMHKNVKSVHIWDPVLVIWLDKVVEGGDILQVLPTIELARQRAIEYKDILSNIKSQNMSSLDNIMMKIKSGSLKQLKIVLKADTKWSLEAIKNALLKLSTEETTVTLIHAWVGNITESDVIMCQWSSALLVGFWVTVIASAKNIIHDTWVELISSEVIYHITEKVEKIVTWMLDPKEVEVILWKATVWGIFYSSKEFIVLWLKVKDESRIEKKCKVRVIKWDKLLGHGDVVSLKEWIEEVNFFDGPGECWIKYAGAYKPEMGDILEFYKIEIHK